MIEIRNLNFHYRGAPPLFRDFNWSLPTSGFYSIFGRSGSGKSTLGRIVAGRLPAAATIIAPTPTLYVSSDDALPDWLSVAQHLTDFASQRGQQLESFWAMAGLTSELGNRLPSQLSLGQRQRINLARYIVQSAPCIILDEALIGVDQPTRWRILQWVKALRKNLVTILISHEIEDVAILSARILKLSSDAPVSAINIQGLDLEHVSTDSISGYEAIRRELLKP